ncbi:MAG: hypothetical protein QS721_13285 [Candidatus Endonucleobacter sp. (ex Gigantidas childressi)]|nr:hypothetical protein [Candidatus Endonucleobacter sp. (ex Gigantidas childressi)]
MAPKQRRTNYKLEGRWTTLDKDLDGDDEIIAPQKDHTTSHRFHSELKTDLDSERLPSRQFSTNTQVMSLEA